MSQPSYRDNSINIFAEVQASSASDKLVAIKKVKIEEVACNLRQQIYKNPLFKEPSLIWDEFKPLPEAEAEVALKAPEPEIEQQDYVDEVVESGQVVDVAYDFKPKKIIVTPNKLSKKLNTFFGVSILFFLASNLLILSLQAQVGGIAGNQKAQMDYIKSFSKQNLDSLKDVLYHLKLASVESPQKQ